MSNMDQNKKLKILAGVFGGLMGAGIVSTGVMTYLYLTKPSGPQPIVLCQVTLDLDGGNIKGETSWSKPVVSGTYVRDLPIPEKDGYKFQSWFEGSRKVDWDEQITSNVNFKATYEASESNNVFAIDSEGNKWICTLDTLCSFEKSIELTKVGTAETKNIQRTDFGNSENKYDIEVGSNIMYLPIGFLANCPNFDGDVTFLTADSNSNLTYIAESFMENDTSFDQTIDFTVCNNLKCVSSSFMCGCSTFNQEIEFADSLEVIGNDFMSGCTSFAQDFYFSQNLTDVGINLFFNCKGLYTAGKTITIDTPIENFITGNVGTMSCTDNITSYTIYIDGATKADFVGAFPDLPDEQTTTSLYRILTQK